MNPTSYCNDSNVPASDGTAKFDLAYARGLHQLELENQQLRRELQDAYRRIQLLEAKVENGCSSVDSTGSFYSVTSSVTTAITGSAQAVQSRRRDQQRCDLETQRPPPRHDKKYDEAVWQKPVQLSSRTASDLTLASHQTPGMIPLLFPSFSNSTSSIDSSSGPWSSEEDTRTGRRQNDMHRIAMRYLERIDSTDSSQ